LYTIRGRAGGHRGQVAGAAPLPRLLDYVLAIRRAAATQRDGMVYEEIPV